MLSLKAGPIPPAFLFLKITLALGFEKNILQNTKSWS